MARHRLADIVAPSPGRAAFALRIALICALTTLVAQTYQTPEAALTTYIAFFVSKADRASSVLTSIVMTILITVVLAVLMLISTVVLDQPPLRVATMAALSLVLLFLASASRLKPFAATVALIAAFALDTLSKVPAGEFATRALLYAWLLVGIPACVSIVVNLLIGAAPRRLAERAIAQRLRAAGDLLTDASCSVRGRVAALRREGGAGMAGLVRLAMLEGTTPRADLSALRQAARSSDAVLMLAEGIAQVPDVPEAWRQPAAAALQDMAVSFDHRLYPVNIEPVPSRSTPLVGPSVDLTADFNELLTGFAVPPSAAPSTPAPRGRFLAADAFINPDHARYAIKVTMAAIACYLFYSLADWPGIHTCLITCYIVALDTTAETIEKLSLRIGGALAGAAAGLAAIVWLTPHIDRIGGLLALVFAGGLAGGWIAAGGPRIAYAGFQLAFAFLLCVVQGASPAFDLSVARDRVIGILIGNAAIYLMFVSVWPVSIARRVDAGIANLCRDLARIARLPDRATRRDALPTAHAAAAKIAADLELAAYEPSSSRPYPNWFHDRQSLLDGLAASEVHLLIERDPARREAEAAWLQAVAAKVDRRRATDAAMQERVLAR